MTAVRPATTVADVLDLYDRWGHHRYDEALSQHDHAAQTAALAAAAGADEELVAAALLHDAGHLLHLDRVSDKVAPAGVDEDHEAVGARYLARLYGPGVTGPIALHVGAKRYRCAVDPAYHRHLSDGSKASLERQGGAFDDAEAARFARHPGCAGAVALRAWDDGGKVDGLDVPPFRHYQPLLERLARG